MQLFFLFSSDSDRISPGGKGEHAESRFSRIGADGGTRRRKERRNGSRRRKAQANRLAGKKWFYRTKIGISTDFHKHPLTFSAVFSREPAATTPTGSASARGESPTVGSEARATRTGTPD